MCKYSKIYRFIGTVFAVAACMLSIGLIDKAQAQHLGDIQPQDLNGIFYPRSSEEFCQEGRERLEDEILLHRTEVVDHEPTLVIDETVPTQQYELEEELWLIELEPNEEHNPKGK